MKIIDWLRGLFRPPEGGIYNVSDYRKQAEQCAALDAYALFTAVHLISGILSGAEFRTFRNGKEIHGDEWYSLNIRPNRNQNAAEWKKELVSRLLMSGEVLVFQLRDGQRLIADGFSHEINAAAPDIFTQVSRAGYTFPQTYRADEVAYLQSAANARSAWLQSMLFFYEKLLQSAANRFDNADGEKGILKISAVERGKQDFAEKFNTLMNEYFKGYFGGKNAVLPLFEGYDYTPQNANKSGTYTNDLTAVKTLADEAISRAAQVFGIPPSYIRGDAAGIADSQAAMMTNCIKPLAAMISAELTGAIYSKSDAENGGFIFVDTGNVLHHDLIGSSTGIDKLMGAGWTINEINRALGQPKNNDPDCDTRFVTKNYGELRDIAEGGEENA